MKNEVPSSNGVGDSEEDLKQLSVSLDIDFKKISKISAFVVVIIAIFAGTTFKTPLPKVDQDLIQATNNLRGLEKVKIEYASGTNARIYKIQVLEKEIVDIGVKNVANDGEIEKTKQKIEKIINFKSKSN